jgi:hypothetical protein
MPPHYNENVNPSSDDEEYVTVLGFGSLMSEKSSRTTFPNLINFRLGRVPNYRRIFAHPSAIFFKHDIHCMDTLQIASLSAEYSPGDSFVCSVFEVPAEGILQDVDTAAPSEAFLKREASYDIQYVYYTEMNGKRRKGILCLASTDEEYINKWGYGRFSANCKYWGKQSIWNWEHDSGLKPNAVYLRHCLIAARKMGKECYDSLLDDTFLVDRETTIREYLEEYPEVWNSKPPAKLALRYGG